MTFSITILGSNSALPTSKRYSTAQLLNINERFFLLDCGEGTQIQLRRYKANLAKIDHILISHLHGDHTFGLFGLISTFGLLQRTKDLHIYADKKLESVISFILEQYQNHISYKIIYHYLSFEKEEIIYEDNRLVISSFPLKHRIPTCGFLFKEKQKLRNINKEAIEEYNIPIKDRLGIQQGNDFKMFDGRIIANDKLTLKPYKTRSYAFVSDTLPVKNILSIIKNVDVLYHDTTFMHTEKKIAKETFHSTAQQSAEIAKDANVRRLLLGHFSARYKKLQPLLDEAKLVFAESYLAKDGDVFSIELER